MQLPESMLQELDRIAPASLRQRSRFIRLAIQRALMEHQDKDTREAYVRFPDVEPDSFDARAWEQPTPKKPRRKRGRKKT